MDKDLCTLYGNTTVLNALLLALGTGALSFALIAQYGFGLAPCILCLYQRVPYALLLGAGLIGILLSKKGKTRAAAITVALGAALLLVGSAIAAYHVGVEQHWWRSFLEGCAVADISKGSAQDILERIMAAPAVRCDQVAWQFMGLSMAGYNVLLSFAAAAFFAGGACRAFRNTKPAR